jgi:hypothetical protein
MTSVIKAVAVAFVAVLVTVMTVPDTTSAFAGQTNAQTNKASKINLATVNSTRQQPGNELILDFEGVLEAMTKQRANTLRFDDAGAGKKL